MTALNASLLAMYLVGALLTWHVLERGPELEAQYPSRAVFLVTMVCAALMWPVTIVVAVVAGALGAGEK